MSQIEPRGLFGLACAESRRREIDRGFAVPFAQFRVNAYRHSGRAIGALACHAPKVIVTGPGMLLHPHVRLTR